MSDRSGNSFKDLLREYLRTGRGNHGKRWSQTAFGARLGRHRDTINNWVVGKTLPSEYDTKLCAKIFQLTDVEYVDFLELLDEADKDSSTYVVESDQSRLVSSLARQYFNPRVVESFLSANIHTLHFRKEWQPLVNTLVVQTRDCMRAMVIDRELTRWWQNLAGRLYMLTNLSLIQREVVIRRIFLVNDRKPRVRLNALKTAKVHDRVGIKSRIMLTTSLKGLPKAADMLSIHDSDFAVFYLLGASGVDFPQAHVVMDWVDIQESIAYYDGIFNNPSICKPVDEVLSNIELPNHFMADVEHEVTLLNRLSNNTLRELITGAKNEK